MMHKPDKAIDIRNVRSYFGIHLPYIALHAGSDTPCIAHN